MRAVERARDVQASPIMSMLSDSVVCITHPTGLGLLYFAQRFAAAGARIVIGARDIDELSYAHADLTRRGADVLAFPCDASDPGDVRELLGMAVRWFGRVDVLINVPSRAAERLRDALEAPLERATRAT